ncbi:MAG: ATP-binding cassette domain-containing protein, partial [Firmicutes bacterium]|nr:ATP-binding cassette domain-containing protein [Bacillota bacterium]
METFVIRDLSFTYPTGEKPALSGISFSVDRGEFVVLCGPSGCGKTTLLNTIGLLDRATEGSYVLNGENVASISSRRQAKLRAKKIGFIF